MSLNNHSVIESANAFMVKIEGLIKEILVLNSIPYYRIESGIEFSEQTPRDTYRPVIRIITYFEDTVNKISDTLHTEFDLAPVDKNQNSNRIGAFTYKHIHFVAGLKTSRQNLTEYKRSADKKFELQVCSMLQDAWVGIEKELGYNSSSVPEELKRDFYRVGALLEMADIEFLKIRSQTAKRSKTSDSLPAATEEMKTTASANGNIALESMDMNAGNAHALDMKVNTVENKKDIIDESLSALINIGDDGAKPLAVTLEEMHKDAPPVAAIATNDQTADKRVNVDGVASNIDNIETFNRNGSGMVEKTTEIVRDRSESGNKPVPFYEAAAKGRLATPVDENAPMTDASLKEYVLHSKVLKEVDMQIAERAGAKLNPEIDIEGDVERLRFLKVYTLKQLHERISDNSEDVVAFAEKWIGKDNGGSFDSGICLFYLEYLLVGKKNDPAFAIEYVVKFISDNDYSARYIIPTYNSIRNAESATAHAHLTLK